MNLQKFSSSQQQADAIFNSTLSTITSILQTKSNILIAVSGGKSPIPLFEKLSTADLDFSKITFTLVDERIVDTSHGDSNENLVRTYLLKNKAAKAKFTGLVDLALSQIEMVAVANQNIQSIDLAILGMGEDGHTASIFPECPELKTALDLNNPATYIITNPFSAKYPRISLTLTALLKIPNLILSINGATKLNVFNEAVNGDNLNYPISYVLARKPDTQIFWYE